MTKPENPPRRAKGQDLRLKIETERETDSRWIAEIADMPGVLAYGRTEAEARARASALKVIAHGVEKSKGGASPKQSAGLEKKMRKAEEITSRYRNTRRALSK